jgi:hypothetical protein
MAHGYGARAPAVTRALFWNRTHLDYFCFVDYTYRTHRHAGLCRICLLVARSDPDVTSHTFDAEVKSPVLLPSQGHMTRYLGALFWNNEL